MSIGNLTEKFLYQRLPQAVVSNDERGLVDAVIGGFQDRLEDLRSYTKRIGDFWVPGALPDGPYNAILADIAGDHGKNYTRSLDISDDTPPEGSPYLSAWAAAQLGLDPGSISNVRYGRDLLRLVDANILSYLAATIGAVLHQSSVLSSEEQQAAHLDLVDTYFPRLKIKGTVQSFEVLGRILGFDDVRVTPLWTRLSPRNPKDVGDPVNDPDFSPVSDYFPSQQVSVFYDPFEYRDGPFFSWSAAVNNGTASTEFYTSAVNNSNPWVDAVILGPVVGGTVQHPSSGSVVLSGGLPNLKASASPEGAGVMFTALTEGESFNGLTINFATSGSLCTVSIDDRLSALKYRSSYFDVAMTAYPENLEERFGSRAVTTNPDMLPGEPAYVSADGSVAYSPYTPWISGSLRHIAGTQDWLITGGTYSTPLIRARVEANPVQYRQLNMDEAITAGVQVVQAMEEVRPATRYPRLNQAGLLMDDKMPFAAFGTQQLLFSAVDGTFVYDGSVAVVPQARATAYLDHIPYLYHTWNATVGAWYAFRAIWQEPPLSGTYVYKDFEVGYATSTQMSYMMPGGWRNYSGISLLHDPFWADTSNWHLTTVYLAGAMDGEYDPANHHLGYYQNVELDVNGTFNSETGTYHFELPSEDWPTSKVFLLWYPETTEIIRDEPLWHQKYTGTIGYQARPEDDYVGTSVADSTLGDVPDDVPWRRDLVIGGELVDLDIYQTGTELAVDTVSATPAVNDQSGAELNVYGITSFNQPFRVTWETRPTDETYSPGTWAIGYRGVFRDLQSYTTLDTTIPKPREGAAPGDTRTDYDTLFEGAYSLYHVGLCYGVLVADLPKFFGPVMRDGLEGWMPFNNHPEDNLAVQEVARTVPVDLYMHGVRAEDRVWDNDRGWYLDLKPDGEIHVTTMRGLENEFTLSFWFRPGQNLATVRLLDYSPVFIDLVQLGTRVQFRAKTAAGVEVQLGTAVVTRGEFNFVTITKSATGYSFGTGTLSTPVTLTTVLGNYAPFNEETNASLVIRAPSAANQETLSQKLDIMFALDFSLSTDPIVASLKTRISEFDAALTGVGFDTRYGFVTFGQTPTPPGAGNGPGNSRFLQDLTDFTTFMATLNAYNPAGSDKMGSECGSYATSLAADNASWRAYSNRMIILLTDENDDNGPIPTPPDPGWDTPNPAIIAEAYSDLTRIGAYFYYAGSIGNLGTGNAADPQVYENLKTTFGGHSYDIYAFVADSGPMLADITALAADLFIGGPDAGYAGVHDLRIWSKTKTQAELNAIRDYQPTPTLCTYPLGVVLTVDRQDRYGMRVLPTGWVTLDRLPATYRHSNLGLVRRYDSMGHYTGQDRYKETGIGGGRYFGTVSDLHVLGQQMTDLTAFGTTVFSGSAGYLPGWSDYWGSVMGQPPAFNEQTNVFREFLWADDRKKLTASGFSITAGGLLVSTVTPTPLSYRLGTRVKLTTTSGPAGWITGVIQGINASQIIVLIENASMAVPPGSYPYSIEVLSLEMYELRLRGGTPPEVHIEATKTSYTDAFTLPFSVATLYGTVPPTTPTIPYYMYLTERLYKDVPSAFSAWTDRWAVTAQDNHVDYLDDPTIIATTGSGNYLVQPVIGKNGFLEFTNAGGYLQEGKYYLRVDSGNIGLLDQDFDGFAVNITVGGFTFARKLLQGKTGYNVRGTDTFEIDIPQQVLSPYLVSFEVTNTLADASKGTLRQLAIYGYSLTKRVNEQYKVDFGPDPAFCTPQIVGYLGYSSGLYIGPGGALYTGTNNAPGGWIASVNSFGTVVGTIHEAHVYTENDTVKNDLPLATVVTGLTNERSEDIIYTGTNVVLSDAALYVLPVFSGIDTAPVQALYQVGDVVTFAVSSTGDTSGVYSYVWKFWDDTGTATSVPQVQKKLNMGGNPGSGPAGLQYSCTPVTVTGQGTVITGTLTANNPPTIDTAAISVNDQYFRYSSRLSVRAFDLENDAMTFSWYNGAVFLGNGVTASDGAVNGTWTGNGVTNVISRSAYRNYLDTVIASERVLTCKIEDVQNGTTRLDFHMRGDIPPNPSAGASAGIEGFFADAASLPAQRVGLGQTMEFTVYARDPAAGSLYFGWSFNGTHGWSMPPQEQNNGVTTPTGDGGYQNVLTRDISSEYIENGTSKLAVALCTVVSTTLGGVQRFTTVEVPVTLIANQEPDSVAVSRTVNGVEVSGAGPVSRAGGDLVFSVTSTDPNGDAATAMWTFYQPFVPAVGYYWGPKVVIPLEQYQAGQTVQGVVTVTDRLGASITQPLTSTTVSA